MKRFTPFHMTRRAILQSLLATAAAKPGLSQGFAGLGRDAEGFAPVVPGRAIAFPEDLGAHPEFRIEWWYVTANLADASGNAYGAQWTLFRSAMRAGAQGEGWDSPQIWMGHAALTSASDHRFGETFARGGVGQAGVESAPFQAWIDAWQMRGGDGFNACSVSPLKLNAATADFSFDLALAADRDLVLQGEGGYSRKSERGQASYYYSQPYFAARGQIAFGSVPIEVSGQAWMDREWSSQPLASDQKGWDWLSLHLGKDKLMLFRLRQTDGSHYFAGNWIGADGHSVALKPNQIEMMSRATARVAGRDIPVEWDVAVADYGVRVRTKPLNPQSWMGTNFAYWEGPIAFQGSHSGQGYLEMTGY